MKIEIYFAFFLATLVNITKSDTYTLKYIFLMFALTNANIFQGRAPVRTLTKKIIFFQ